MFCPKCGIENPDNGKFCRSCGANLSNVLAVVDGELPAETGLTVINNPTELYSTGIRNVVLGLGFLLAGVFLFTIPPREGIFWLLMMIPGFCLLASGVGRIIKSNAMKKEREARANIVQQSAFPASKSIKELPPTQADYIGPVKSIYEIEDLEGEPLSITENTTRHLKINSEGETMTLPKKQEN